MLCFSKSGPAKEAFRVKLTLCWIAGLQYGELSES